MNKCPDDPLATVGPANPGLEDLILVGPDRESLLHDIFHAMKKSQEFGADPQADNQALHIEDSTVRAVRAKGADRARVIAHQSIGVLAKRHYRMGRMQA